LNNILYDTENDIDALVRFKIQYRTLVDLCGLCCCRLLHNKLDVLKTLIPDDALSRIETLSRLEYFPTYPRPYQVDEQEDDAYDNSDDDGDDYDDSDSSDSEDDDDDDDY